MRPPGKATGTSRLGRLWRLAGLLFSLTLAALLLDALDLNAFRLMAAGVSPANLLLALLIYLLLNIFRTLRFHLLLPADAPSLSALWPVVLVHNFLVRVLPFKTGELSWLLLLRRHFGQGAGAGFGSLVSARAFELLILLLVGGTALVQVRSGDAPPPAYLSLLPPLMFLLCLALLFQAGPLLQLANGLLQRRFQPGASITAGLAALEASFAQLRLPRVFLLTLALSCLTWGSSICFNLVLLGALGLHGLPLLVGIISITMLVEALPVASISGLGVIEGGWTFGLVSLAGLEPGTAAATGFFLHACQVLAAALCGLAGWLWLRRLPRMEVAS